VGRNQGREESSQEAKSNLYGFGLREGKAYCEARWHAWVNSAPIFFSSAASDYLHGRALVTDGRWLS